MKVTGPGSGAPPADERPGGSEGVAGKAGPEGPSGPHKPHEQHGLEKPDAARRSFAETLAAGRPAEAPASASPPTSTKAAGGVDPLTSDIAADLQAGKIDPKAALDRVVERVLDQQLGAHAPAALRDQLRDALRDTISSDPLLTDRLRGLS